jgi:hypothetical protein
MIICILKSWLYYIFSIEWFYFSFLENFLRSVLSRTELGNAVLDYCSAGENLKIKEVIKLVSSIHVVLVIVASFILFQKKSL